MSSVEKNQPQRVTGLDLVRVLAGLIISLGGMAALVWVGITMFRDASWTSLTEELNARSVVILPVFVSSVGISLIAGGGGRRMAPFGIIREAVLLTMYIFSAALLIRLFLFFVMGLSGV